MTEKEENDHLIMTTAAKEEYASFTTTWVLTHAGATALRNYQYRGQDLSLTYKYVLSPLAEWCVDHLTPAWLAPNVITLTGLICMVVSYVVMWWYAPMILQSSEDNEEMDRAVPRWVFFLSAGTILIYQTLDNMDGKQARRVGASSPLGLFFDHGCDAINSVFGSVNWMIALALAPNDSLHCFVMLMGPYALFYFSTWEEYYTGELIMPILNGPNEGLLGAVFVNAISCWYGPSYWHTHSWWKSTIQPIFEATSGRPWTVTPLRNADLLICVSGMCMIQEMALKTVAIVRRYGLRSLWNLLPFLALASCMVIVSITDYNLWMDMPRTSVHLSSILFVDMTTDLMLQHMTHRPYQPFRWMMLPLILFTIAVATKHWFSKYCSMADFLLIYTASAGMFLTLNIVVTIHEMCLALNITCFSVPSRQRNGLVSNGHHDKSD
jgi:ethanolaminephosphotransferase